MVRGGEVVGQRSNFKRRVRSKDEDSDDSDEDYVASLEGNEESEDDAEYYCPSFDECASEEGFQSFIDDDEEEKEVRKVVRTKGKRISPARTKKTVGRKSRNWKAVSDEDDDYDYDEEEVRKVVRSKDRRFSSAGMRKIVDRTSRKRKSISDEEDDDEDYEEEEMRKIVDRKSQKRKGVSVEDEEEEEDDDEDYKEEEMGKIVDRKSRKWKSISDEEDDDEDYEEEEEEIRKIVNRKSKKREGVFNEEEEDDDNDDDDYKEEEEEEEEEMGKIVDRKSRKQKSISDEEDDDGDYEEEEEMRKIVDRKSKKRKGVSDEENDDDEDYEEEEMGKIVDKKSRKRKSISDEDDDDEDYEEEEEMRKIVDRKSQKRNVVSDEEEEDDEDYKEEEDEEVMRKLVDRKPQKRKGTSDEEEEEEDYKEEEEEEVMRKLVDRKPQKRKGTSDEDDDDEDYKDEEEEMRKIVDRKSQEWKGISDEEEEDDENYKEEEMSKIVDRKLQKRENASDEEDDDEDYKEEEEMRKIVDRKSQKRNGVSDEEDEDYKEVEEEEEEEDDDLEFTLDEEDDDVEFILDDEDCLDEEEELTMKKKKNNNISKQGLRKKGPSNHREKRKKSAVSKKPLRNGGNKKRRLKRKSRIEEEEDDDDCDFIDKDPIVRKKSRKFGGQRKTACVIHSDSDFVSSGSSDHEFTISEEEREQVKEASQMCGSLKTNLRSSSSTKRTEEVEEYKKPLARKGKEKVEETKGEVIKPVCGICLSEEDKRRLRGKLNCCSHYFCFTCIMEWSKVESRCPLCKQRFETISKSARSTAVADSRDVVIQVPKRDQVYQPSEEELRSYLDPYENVICSECNQGGDDELMLLCDICDSSAHTYCVGLRREVPEGNWYCDGCRPVALGSSSSQVQDSLPDQRSINNLYNRFSPVVNLGESLDPISVPSPRTSFPPGFVGLSSPRFPVVDMPPVSPVSGMGAQTLTGRRWLHRQIQNLRSFNRMNLMAGMTDGISTANMGIDLINSHIDQSRQTTVQQAMTQHIGTQHQTVFTDGFQDNPSSSMQSSDLFSPRLGHLRRQPVQDSTTTTLNTSVNMMLWPPPAGINLNEQLYQCSNGSNIGPDVFATPFSVRQQQQQQQQQQQSFSPKNEDNSSMAKEQLQVMVRSQLKALSNGTDLDNCTFTDIATSSMHTILAACGLEHRRSEVHIVPPPSNCTHIERVVAGQTSLMKGCCLTCFDSFVKDVVKRIMDTRSRQWLSLGL